MPLFTTTAYLAPSDAQTYFDGRLNSDAWNNASLSNQTAALLQATRAIDRLNFAGLRTYDYNQRLTTLTDTGVITNNNIVTPSPVGQDHEFPRDGNTTVPEEILIACCECAIAFLDGVDPELELQSLSSVHQGFAAVRETYDPHVVKLAYRHGIPSMVAWTYLYPFLADPSEVQFRRVN
jgi:hypothetical protein